MTVRPRCRWLPLLALLLLLAGCGPDPGLHFTLAQKAANLHFGDQVSPTPTPAVASATPPSLGVPNSFPMPLGLASPPPTTRTTLPSPPPPSAPACPTAPPDAVPAIGDLALPPGAPVSAQYTFNQRSSSKTQTGSTQTTTVGPPSFVLGVSGGTVTPTLPDNRPVVTFTTTETNGSTVLTTAYELDPGTTGNTGGPTNGGVEITSIVEQGTPAQSFTFNVPHDPVVVMNLPAGPDKSSVSTAATANPTLQSGGVDPVDGTALTVVHQTMDHERVDACGQVVEAWLVDLSGTFTDNGSMNGGVPISVSFTGSIDVAVQYGGLIVSDNLTYQSGTGSAVTMSGTRLATITQPPLPVQH